MMEKNQDLLLLIVISKLLQWKQVISTSKTLKGILSHKIIEKMYQKSSRKC
mgnify:CR=1 FL=1